MRLNERQICQHSDCEAHATHKERKLIGPMAFCDFHAETTDETDDGDGGDAKMSTRGFVFLMFITTLVAAWGGIATLAVYHGFAGLVG